MEYLIYNTNIYGVFQIALRGGGIRILFWDFLLGGGNMRSDFDHSNLFQS